MTDIDGVLFARYWYRIKLCFTKLKVCQSATTAWVLSSVYTGNPSSPRTKNALLRKPNMSSDLRDEGAVALGDCELAVEPGRELAIATHPGSRPR